jgi:hypothetical protein
MSKPNEHSQLINAAAKAVLQPLGFRQKGRSRVWFADRGFWALVVEFQPSGFGKGSYLNIAATWFWHPDSDWGFNYMRRASGLVPFETSEQFQPKDERLAKLAAAETAQLDKKFISLDRIADHLKEEVNDPRLSQNPWTLYHGAIVTALTGDDKFSLNCFSELIKQNATADWHKKIQHDALLLAKLVPEREKFQAIIRKRITDARGRLKLPPLGEPS